MADTVDVVVGLGSRLADLEHKGTRWRAVLARWAQDPRVGSLTVLDYPRFGPRASAHRQDCWLEGAASVAVQVAGRRAGGPGTRLGARLTARRLGALLPGAADRRVVVAASPLWLPLLQRVPAARHGLDGVDDWRAYGPAQAVRRRVAAGYACAPGLDAVTAVSDELADRLRTDYGAAAETVGNGVDLLAFSTARPLAHPGLPDGRFAVYIGSVEERVDLDLLAAVAARLPVVVAGPASPALAADLAARGCAWLGPLAAEQVPGLLARASVGLLPHHRTALTASMDPLKLLEYVAAGLPVVSTALPGVAQWPAVAVADDPAAFAAAAERAAAGPRASVPDALRARDWDVVADRLLLAHAGGLL